jgi:hypothetical protein
MFGSPRRRSTHLKNRASTDVIGRDDLLNEIDRLAEGDTPPTKREMVRQGKWSHSTYQRRFDSWNEALREAGYQPNVRTNIRDEELLRELARTAQGRIAPKQDDCGKYARQTYEHRFGSWWQACVRAGCQPRERRPLTPSQYLDFFEAATDQKDPERQLVALLCQFTGLPPQVLADLSESWTTRQAGDIIVTVPPERTTSSKEWVFKLPSMWSGDDGRRPTDLPGLLEWYFDHHDSIQVTYKTIRRIVRRVAADADLEARQHSDISRIGVSPVVRPEDLRATGGVRMAHNGAPARRIRRHLGLEHTNWRATVEDFFVWCDVHSDDFSHPDYDG